MKIKELVSKSIEELKKDLIAFKKELFNLRFRKVQGQVDKTHRVRQVKKTVARINTLLREMELGIKKKEKKIKKSVIKEKIEKAPKEEVVKEVKKEIASEKDDKAKVNVKGKISKEKKPKKEDKKHKEDKKQKIIKDKKNA